MPAGAHESDWNFRSRESVVDRRSPIIQNFKCKRLRKQLYMQRIPTLSCKHIINNEIVLYIPRWWWCHFSICLHQYHAAASVLRATNRVCWFRKPSVASPVPGSYRQWHLYNIRNMRTRLLEGRQYSNSIWKISILIHTLLMSLPATCPVYSIQV